MLDRLPAVWRHLIIALAPALLAWVASDLIPQLPPGVAAVAAPALSIALLACTNLTRQYGVGSDESPEGGS